MEQNQDNTVFETKPPRNPYATGQFTPPPAQDAPDQTPAAPRTHTRRLPFSLEKRDLIFAGITAALTLFGVIVGLWGGFRAGFAAAFLLNFVSLSVYLGKGNKPTAYGTLCGMLSLALLPGFALTSNEAVRFLSVIGAAALSVIWFASLSGRAVPTGELGLVQAVGAPLLDAPGNLDLTLRGLLRGGEGRRRSLKIILGVLCAVPVLCVVIPLLTRSDAAFEGLLKNVFTDLGRLAAQLAVSALLILPALSFSFSLRKQEKQTTPMREGKGLDPAFLTAFLSALGVAYAVYLFSQLAYFFTAFRGILPAGYDFSYAEYARRGFFELCGVAAVNLALILGTLLFARKKEGRLPAAIKALGAYLSLFTLVLIGTALAKMSLYIKNYGMTVLRLGVSAFTVFMGVVFLAVIARIFIKRVRVLQVSAVAAALVLAALGVCNMNGVAANYNYSAYTAGTLHELDVSYLGQLGPEGVPYLVEIMENEKETPEHRRQAAMQFYIVCRDTLYENEWTEEKRFTINGDVYSYVGYTFTSPAQRKAPRLSQFSLPLDRAYKAADAFLQAHPDFLEREDALTFFYGESWGYFDAADTMPKPDDWALNNYMYPAEREETTATAKSGQD